MEEVSVVNASGFTCNALLFLRGKKVVDCIAVSVPKEVTFLFPE